MIGYGFRCYGRGGLFSSPIFKLSYPRRDQSKAFVIWVLGVFRGGVKLPLLSNHLNLAIKNQLESSEFTRMRFDL